MTVCPGVKSRKDSLPAGQDGPGRHNRIAAAHGDLLRFGRDRSTGRTRPGRSPAEGCRRRAGWNTPRRAGATPRDATASCAAPKVPVDTLDERLSPGGRPDNALRELPPSLAERAPAGVPSRPGGSQDERRRLPCGELSPCGATPRRLLVSDRPMSRPSRIGRGHGRR